jgi:exopolysaccharide biosynthesis polyprenyl glycosylphosphotransferase
MPTSEVEIVRPEDAAPEPVADAIAGTTLELPGRDVRRKRPPALSFLVGWSTVRQMLRIAALLVIDFVGLYAAILTALIIKAVAYDKFNFAVAFVETRRTIAFGFLVMVLLFARSSLYASRAERPGLTRIVSCLFQTTVVTLIFAVVSGHRFQSYYIFWGSLIFATIYIGSLRYLYERATGLLGRVTGRTRRALLVGSGEQIEAVGHALIDSGQRLELIGYLSLTPRPGNGLRALGPVEGLPAVLDSQHVDEVIIADPDFPQEKAIELVDECHRRGVRVRVAPTTMEILTHRAELVPGQSMPLFELTPPVFEGFDYVLKRSFDVVVSLLLVVVLSPLLLAIALAVRLSSRGPILYQSRRPGLGGAPFNCFKFRTMSTGAEEMQADLEAVNEASGALFKIRRDPRLTTVGRVLRRFSLDELPQLLNVLRGQMSLVGPRPLPMRDYNQLADWHKKRYLVLPGITGLWQVSGRSNLDFDDLVRLDFLYLERWSVFLDLTILLKTVPAVLTRKGAF